MAVDLRGVTAVLLPGTGSDDDYVYRAFSAALHDVGAVVVTPPPQPDRLIDGYVSELDNAARLGAIAVGGVSIGAAVAVNWALAHPTRAVAVLAALAAVDGLAGVRAGRAGGQALRRCAAPRRAGVGDLTDARVEPRLAGRRTDPVLGRAMARAARRHGGGVAATSSPTCAELEALTVPMGVAAATDDPVHPLEVGFEWVAAAPRWRRCGPSRWTRWAPTRRCSARRAWPRCSMPEAM